MKKYTKEELLKMDAVDVYKMVLKGDVIKIFPSGFWQQPEAKQNAAKCTTYLIEKILNLNEDELKNKNSVSMFSKNKLAGMLATCFNHSPYEAIDNAYPNKYKEWEFKIVPMGFWTNKENGIKATKWLIEEKLKLNDKQLKNQLSAKLFIENGLSGMLQHSFTNSPYEAIDSVYPNKYKEWEFKCTPQGYWDSKENGIKATKWLIEEKLKLSGKELKEQLSKKLFIENGLSGMLQYCFNDSPYEAIDSVYPNKYKEWEFKITPTGYWDSKENGIKATKWLIEEKLKLSDKELKEQLSVNLFKDNGLASMLQHCFNGSPHQAINSTYPNKYKEWEFKNVPRGFWEKDDNRIKAIKWMIEEKLKLNDEEIKNKLSVKMFDDNGLGGMLSNYFKDSAYEAINSVYPDKYKRWEFKHVSNGYWKNKVNGIEATKWFIEEKLSLNDEQIKEKLSAKLFIENGLGGMLQHCFNNSPYEAINAIYPNKFKKSDFKGYN